MKGYSFFFYTNFKSKQIITFFVSIGFFLYFVFIFQKKKKNSEIAFFHWNFTLFVCLMINTVCIQSFLLFESVWKQFTTIHKGQDFQKTPKGSHTIDHNDKHAFIVVIYSSSCYWWWCSSTKCSDQPYSFFLFFCF